MQAINDYVIAKESKKEEKTASGLIMGVMPDPTVVTATVVSVGEDTDYLTGGEEVMFLRQNSKEITCDGEPYLAVASKSVILKLKEKDNG